MCAFLIRDVLSKANQQGLASSGDGSNLFQFLILKVAPLGLCINMRWHVERAGFCACVCVGVCDFVCVCGCTLLLGLSAVSQAQVSFDIAGPGSRKLNKQSVRESLSD